MYFLQFSSSPLDGVLFLLAIVITVSIHEYAHARAADELGDPTPEISGRLTLDPRAHLDPIGSLLFLLVGFGWGKPVPFDPFNLNNPRRDAAIISFAGPASNFVVALASAVLIRLLPLLEPSIVTFIGSVFLAWLIRVNIILGIFNLLPFAPLDGFKFVGGFMAEKQAPEWYALERYGIIFLLFFIFPFVGGRSMLEIFVIPVFSLIAGVLLP
ncbi:MAG: site-2 protease family protein [Candidatus Paceibacterota bacterium]